MQAQKRVAPKRPRPPDCQLEAQVEAALGIPTVRLDEPLHEGKGRFEKLGIIQGNQSLQRSVGALALDDTVLAMNRFDP